MASDYKFRNTYALIESYILMTVLMKTSALVCEIDCTGINFFFFSMNAFIFFRAPIKCVRLGVSVREIA